MCGLELYSKKETSVIQLKCHLNVIVAFKGKKLRLLIKRVMFCAFKVFSSEDKKLIFKTLGLLHTERFLNAGWDNKIIDLLFGLF